MSCADVSPLSRLRQSRASRSSTGKAIAKSSAIFQLQQEEMKVSLRAILVSATAVAVLVAPGMAVAAPMACSARTDVLTTLATNYHQQLSSMALTSDGRLLEILKSRDATTWSILITTPKGVSCVIAAGENWLELINRSIPQF